MVKRLAIPEAVRKLYVRAAAGIPLPKASPNHLSALSLIASIGFPMAFRLSRTAGLAFLAAALAFDVLDGAVARKYQLESREGYLVDLYSDRLSEGLVVSALPVLPWTPFFIANCLLALWGSRSGRHYIMPLRGAALVWLLLGGF